MIKKGFICQQPLPAVTGEIDSLVKLKPFCFHREECKCLEETMMKREKYHSFILIRRESRLRLITRKKRRSRWTMDLGGVGLERDAYCSANLLPRD